MGDFFAFDGGQKWKFCQVLPANTASGNVKTAYSGVANPVTTTSPGFWVHTGVNPGNNGSHFLSDVALGSTSDPIVNNLWLPIAVASGRRMTSAYFPLRIPAASSFFVRQQSNITGIGLRYIIIPGYSGFHAHSFNACDTYGADTANSRGTGISFLTTVAWTRTTTWTRIGTVVQRPLRGILIGWGATGNISNAATLVLSVAIGDSNGPTRTILSGLSTSSSAGKAFLYNGILGPYYINIPSSVFFWANVAASVISGDPGGVIIYGLR